VKISVAVLASSMADHGRGCRGVDTRAAGDAGLSGELEWFVNGGSGSGTNGEEGGTTEAR